MFGAPFEEWDALLVFALLKVDGACVQITKELVGSSSIIR